jgi:hypothetical protein
LCSFSRRVKFTVRSFRRLVLLHDNYCLLL